MQVTKSSKPSMERVVLDDSASVPAVTRVNAEQASKRVPRQPGNAGGGKGPGFKVSAGRGESPGDWR